MLHRSSVASMLCYSAFPFETQHIITDHLMNLMQSVTSISSCPPAPEPQLGSCTPDLQQYQDFLSVITAPDNLSEPPLMNSFTHFTSNDLSSLLGLYTVGGVAVMVRNAIVACSGVTADVLAKLETQAKVHQLSPPFRHEGTCYGFSVI